jgi:hypothetical protein
VRVFEWLKRRQTRVPDAQQPVSDEPKPVEIAAEVVALDESVIAYEAALREVEAALAAVAASQERAELRMQLEELVVAVNRAAARRRDVNDLPSGLSKWREILGERAGTVVGAAAAREPFRPAANGPVPGSARLWKKLDGLWPGVFVPPTSYTEGARSNTCHVCAGPVVGGKCDHCGASALYRDVALPGPAAPGSLSPYGW